MMFPRTGIFAATACTLVSFAALADQNTIETIIIRAPEPLTVAGMVAAGVGIGAVRYMRNRKKE